MKPLRLASTDLERSRQAVAFAARHLQHNTETLRQLQQAGVEPELLGRARILVDKNEALLFITVFQYLRAVQ